MPLLDVMGGALYKTLWLLWGFIQNLMDIMGVGGGLYKILWAIMGFYINPYGYYGGLYIKSYGCFRKCMGLYEFLP